MQQAVGRELLVSASSQLFGGTVVPATHDFHSAQHQILCIDDVFEASRQEMPAAYTEERFDIKIRVLPSKRSFRYTVQGENVIGELKETIEDDRNIPANKISLLFNGRLLRDEQTFNETGIGPGSNLRMLMQQRGGKFNLDLSQLHPKYDYDFTHKKPQPKEKYVRGGYVYDRPYGWNRLALRVLGRYENDVWLGPNGIRTHSVRREWPVSYHGTKRESVDGILESGLFPGKRKVYGQGVYTCPSIEVVAHMYADTFRHTDGKKYQIIFQNRVNPSSSHLTIIDQSTTRVKADYWLSPLQDVSTDQIDVRPYGILFRRA